MQIILKQEIASGSLGTQICQIDINESITQFKFDDQLIQDIKSGIYVGKCIPKSSEFSMKLLDNEENVLSQLNHPNIIKSAGSTEDDEKKVLILEGFFQDLDCFIYNNSDPLPKFGLFELKSMICDIGRALEYLHDVKKMAHNDIKPNNILCDEDNNYILSDFGTAVSTTDNTQQSLYDLLSLINKTYCAPEIFDFLQRNISDVNPCISDIFSFGLVIFQMMFGGQLPFENNIYVSFDRKFSLLQTSPESFFDKPEFSEYTSFWKSQYGVRFSLFIDFIQRILHPDPKKRMTASDILDHQWLESC